MFLEVTDELKDDMNIAMPDETQKVLVWLKDLLLQPAQEILIFGI